MQHYIPRNGAVKGAKEVGMEVGEEAKGKKKGLENREDDSASPTANFLPAGARTYVHTVYI
jgi:hypothetical protein